jgi:hypothetical protein
MKQKSIELSAIGKSSNKILLETLRPQFLLILFKVYYLDDELLVLSSVFVLA